MRYIFFLLLLSMLSFNCQKESSSENFAPTNPSATLPVLTTITVSSITNTTASCGGNITADGGATVTARGVCWGTTSNPVATGNHTTDGIGTGTFTSTMTGLTAGTTYHVRAYANNSVGTAYGGDSVFTTSPAAPPNVYVVGDSYNGTFDVATFWKNSVASSLANGTNISYADAVFVAGTDV